MRLPYPYLTNGDTFKVQNEIYKEETENKYNAIKSTNDANKAVIDGKIIEINGR